MQLTRLTIAGFKSFAKTTEFAFPVATSAVVGPNGSGKSNVAEAIRWVLGEQSLKTLRGKKGEDLIFNGSPTVSRMGKASVGLTFDNRDHAIPLDFAEVTMERKIFRDGTNEYYLNNSQVRLKDIVELLARLGLGETKHNIIGQGEVDRILLASAEERRSMLEEAIGLRLYQLKKKQAERRLAQTDENIQRVGSLLRELAPHVKFLKSQADKAEKAETVRHDLEEHVIAFITKERGEIDAAARSATEELLPLSARLKSAQRDIEALGEIGGKGKAGTEEGANETRSHELKLQRLEDQRRELERELGRIEGRLETAAPRRGQSAARDVDVKTIEARILPFVGSLREVLENSELGEVKKRIATLADKLESEIRAITKTPESETLESDLAASLRQERERIQKSLEEITGTLRTMKEELEAGTAHTRSLENEFRVRFARLRELEDERNEIQSRIQRLGFGEERLEARRVELQRIVHEASLSREALKQNPRAELRELAPEDLRKKIDRLKIRLEEIGGIDEAVLKEYRETENRHEFLLGEIKDLEKAATDLRGLIEELDQRIERDFKDGFAKIKTEFHTYFRIIFGGGKGTLSYIPLRSRPVAENEDEPAGESEPLYGIDIDVELPRKRIKGLEMLSGGERALISIALLFAITAVNPPPFLILDETDAALDEANSQKYATILKELSKKTQLIIITHNRETMKQAGVLYGVTMGEDGVSKVLSLKLEEAADYGNR